MRSRSRWRRLLDAFLRPELPEERAAAARAWERLPESVRTPDQVLGTASAGCAATYGVLERCNLWCTACYLAKEANQSPPLPFEEVRAQLDRIRAFLGPWGNVQITAGEVTLLPVEELARVLDHCRQVQLSPMLMTNGTVLLEDEAYLERLVREGGLANMAVHVDTTQAGRRDAPVTGDERALDPLRDRFAEKIRATRRRTGKPLSAAHTVTITADNLERVPDVVRWALANADAFRMLSFQPTADVGRTTASPVPGGRAAVWERICAGLGVDANDRAWSFGHPDCSSVAMAFVVDLGGRRRVGEQVVVEVTRKGKRLDRWFFRRLIHGGLAGWRPAGEGAAVGAARLLGRLARHPRILLDAALFSLVRAWTERRVLGRMALALLRGRIPRVHPWVLVVHHFMDATELATERGRERVQACAFRVPVDGEMVSMCELNATDLRRRLNERDRARLRPEPEVELAPEPRHEAPHEPRREPGRHAGAAAGGTVRR